MNDIDLLQNPNNYHYASYLGGGYVEEYFATKSDAINSFFQNNSTLVEELWHPFEGGLLKSSLTFLDEHYREFDFGAQVFSVLQTRHKLIENGSTKPQSSSANTICSSKTIFTRPCLEQMLQNQNPQISVQRTFVGSVNFFLKRFEIQKRLFKQYTKNPVCGQGGYIEPEPYIYLSQLLCKLYLETKNLKYLNTLLKLNDTLSSMLIFGYLTKSLHLYYFVSELCAVNFVKQIWSRKHV